MTTDYKVTELFCIIDDFCKLFEAENAGKLLIDDKNHKRRKMYRHHLCRLDHDTRVP